MMPISTSSFKSYTTVKRTLLAILTGAMLLSLASCKTTATNRRQLNFMSDAQLNKMGAQTYQNIIKKSKLSKNRRLVRQVEEIGRRIAAASGANFNWEFVVIEDDKQVNAFCLPGGKIAVYTGILPVAKNNAGLAAIMGHEVAHAVLRHGGERMSQAMLVNIGLTVANVALQNNRNRQLIAGALGAGATFGIMMPFSRSNETEADRLGIEYMAKAGYDPSESVTLWHRMAAAGGGRRQPEMLSTHPDPIRRANDLKKMLPRVAGMYASSSKQRTRNLAH